jgi:long-chain acyl-CoA synthetase
LGDKKEQVCCLINIDPIVVGKWAEDKGISFTTFMDLSQKTEVVELMYQQVEAFNQGIEKEHYRIHRFAVLYKLLDMDDGELTKTGKIRREFVQKKYQVVIDALFDDTLKEKRVEAEYQYQDGQTTTVETTISFQTMK